MTIHGYLHGTLVAGMVFAHLGCTLNTNIGPILETDARPPMICPGEVVEVTWDAGEQFDTPVCMGRSGGLGVGPSLDECILMSMTSTPIDLVSSSIDPFDTMGSLSVAVGVDTTFTTSFRVEDFEDEHGDYSGSKTASVDVLESPRNLTNPSFPGKCLGARAAWEGVLNLARMMSKCVRIDEICNVGSTAVSLNTMSGPSDSSISLARSSCTEALNGQRPILAPRIPEDSLRSNTCGGVEGAGPPPGIELTINFVCDPNLPACPL